MLLIKNGFMIDPASGVCGIRTILIKDGIIAKVCEGDINEESADRVIDATGMIVAPGLVDAHVHFRDPGFTEKEDILTGGEAAKAGGFTSVIMMGNTEPHMDNVDTIKYALEKGKKTGIKVYTCGNITANMDGKIVTNMDELLEAGAVLFTDDGKPIVDETIMEAACRESARLSKVLSLHEENPEFITENGINSGDVALKLGLKGSPRQAEISMVERDIEIAERTGAELTIQHISTKEAVELIRDARKTNKKIHAEATPHHFTLTDEAVLTHGTMAKMNPPLRKEEDRQAIIKGIADGTIETIATDHAPHTFQEKQQEFKKAPSGIIGLETSLGLGIRELVHKGYMDMSTLLSRMTVEPAKIYGLDAGEIKVGKEADLVIFNENEMKCYDSFRSKAENSPFKGESLPGKVHYTICRGKVVYEA
ncbi:MAG: dihydroorotase [Butyrivibrio sp.]|nr:dihydroorotase [Butyrivibrio sp.]